MQIQTKLKDSNRDKGRGKSDLEDVKAMYDILLDECDSFGWDKMTKPFLATVLENEFLPDDIDSAWVVDEKGSRGVEVEDEMHSNSRSPTPDRSPLYKVRGKGEEEEEDEEEQEEEEWVV